jgi:hypothetical protein
MIDRTGSSGPAARADDEITKGDAISKNVAAANLAIILMILSVIPSSVGTETEIENCVNSASWRQ